MFFIIPSTAISLLEPAMVTRIFINAASNTVTSNAMDAASPYFIFFEVSIYNERFW